MIHRGVRPALALAALLSVPGCGTTGARPVREALRAPQVDVGGRLPGSTVETADPPVEFPLDAPEGREVWTLTRCIERALRSNRAVLDAEAGVWSAEDNVIAADGAFQLQVLPFVSTSVDENGDDVTSAGLTLGQQFRVGTNVVVEPISTRSLGRYETGYTATLSQPLLRGASREFNESGVDSARFGARSARRSRFLVQVNITLATARAVYSIVQQRETVRLQREASGRSRQHMIAARSRERAGLSNSLDVFRATQQLRRAEEALAIAEQSLEDAKDGLRVLLALPLDTPLEVDAPLALASEDPPLEAALEQALKSRIELAQARDQARNAKRLSSVAEHNILPDLDVVLAFQQSGEDGSFGDSLGLGSGTMSIGVTGSADVRRIGERAAARQAQRNAEVAVRALSLQRDRIHQDVRNALRSLERSRKSIRIQEDQIVQAEGKLTVARKKYELGLATNFDVIEAEDELRRAETALIRAFAGAVIGQFELRAAVGSLVVPPEGVS